MTSQAVSLAADALPPVEGRVLADVAVAAVNAVLDISALAGRFVAIQNSGVNRVFFLFGDATTVVDPAATSGATCGAAIEAGDTIERRFPEQLEFTRSGSNLRATHIAYRTAAGASELRIWIS